MEDVAPPTAPPRYERICKLARGGMGRVDLVTRREGSFTRVYALKRLLPDFADDDEIRAMFLEEARIAGLVRHANVVSVLDVGEDDEGPFLLMDFVEGVSVGRILQRVARRGELLPLQVAVEIAGQAAQGLHAAHTLRGPGGRPVRAIHRDVSPQNILVGFDGFVRVTDFGVARALDRASLTGTGVLKGKLGYSSPEQLQHRPLDTRTDLFSLGAVLYELAAGKRLYRGEPSDVLHQIVDGAPPDLGDAREQAPPSLVALLFELLAKDPDRRPADAQAVADRLDEVRRQLDADLGPLSLAQFVCAHFAEEREEQRHLVETAIDHTVHGLAVSETETDAAADTHDEHGVGATERAADAPTEHVRGAAGETATAQASTRERQPTTRAVGSRHGGANDAGATTRIWGATTPYATRPARRGRGLVVAAVAATVAAVTTAVGAWALWSGGGEPADAEEAGETAAPAEPSSAAAAPAEDVGSEGRAPTAADEGSTTAEPATATDDPPEQGEASSPPSADTADRQRQRPRSRQRGQPRAPSGRGGATERDRPGESEADDSSSSQQMPVWDDWD